MNKKKKHLTNNDIKVIVEIDYEKLANTIIQAGLHQDNKNKKKSSIRIKLMKWCNGIVYIGLCIISILKIINIWNCYFSQSVSTVNDLVNSIVFTGIFVAIVIFLFLSQQESFDDKDEDVEKYFNVNIGLVALILALITLNR